MTSHNHQEPIVGDLVATTEDSESQKIVKQSEDDKDSKTEEQQEIIVVNQEEKEPENEEEQQIIVVNVQPESDQESEEEQQQQKIVVNIQPPEESNEEESDDDNNEEAPQSLTIIEEPEPTYIPPAEEEPRYSAATETLVSTFTGRTGESNYINKNYRGEGVFDSIKNGIAHFFDYWLDDNATNITFTNVNGGSSVARNLDVGGLLENSLFDPDGRGPQTVCDPVSSIVASDCQTINSYLFPKPNSGRLTATYSKSNGFSGIYSYEGRSGNLTGDVSLAFSYGARSDDKSVYISGNIGNNIIMNGDNFGTIAITVSIDPETGTFNTDDHPYGGNPYFAERRAGKHIPYAFKVNENVNSGTTRSVVGSFSNDGSAGNARANLPNHIAGEIRMEGFYQGSDATNSQHNKLVGVFVGDKK